MLEKSIFLRKCASFIRRKIDTCLVSQVSKYNYKENKEAHQLTSSYQNTVLNTTVGISRQICKSK